MNIFNPDFVDFINALNQNKVAYLLVGGYAVIIRGYSRSTGDMDIWVHKTPENYILLQKAIQQFGLPEIALPKALFFSEDYDVFTFGRPPMAIEIMTQLKGVFFEEAFAKSTIENSDGISVRVIHINQLIQAKKAAGRYKDLHDIDNLPPEEE